jgi:CRISPR system Cascade subunit CasC
MSEFVQLHILTSYPPSNLNRDDLGRPKTAMFGGSQRQRISSQSLKRSWRESAHFLSFANEQRLGSRTRIRRFVTEELERRGVDPKRVAETAERALTTFRNAKKDKKEKKKKDNDEAIAFVTPAALFALRKIIDSVANNQTVSAQEWSAVVDDGMGVVDIALFGRMLADDPSRNVDAAIQVAHAITVHKVAIEDDYFTAVDDLNRREEHSGAGHVNVAEFGAGLFYVYCCINRTLLSANLSGDEELVDRAVSALTEAAATTGPKGKINSFGSYAYASYILAERGERQPRNLSIAFLKDVPASAASGGFDGDYLSNAIAALEKTRRQFDRAYGPNGREHYVLDVRKDDGGTLDELLSFVKNGAREKNGEA